MTSIVDSSVNIHTSAELAPWFGEVVLLVTHLKKQGVLTKLWERVRFARRRFGRYEVIDFLAVLFGYAISGERTLEEFYESLQPFAIPFIALFDRDQLPARSTLSRFLAALTEEPVEALRTLFLDDLLARPLTHDKQTGGLVDRAGNTWVVFDLDGTREAARQRALPQGEDLPRPFADWMRSVLQGTQDANAGRSSGRAPRSLRRIAINGSAVSGTEATDATARNYARGVPQSRVTLRHTSSLRLVPCSGSMGNMARELCFPMWSASRL